MQAPVASRNRRRTGRSNLVTQRGQRSNDGRMPGRSCRCEQPGRAKEGDLPAPQHVRQPGLRPGAPMKCKCGDTHSARASTFAFDGEYIAHVIVQATQSHSGSEWNPTVIAGASEPGTLTAIKNVTTSTGVALPHYAYSPDPDCRLVRWSVQKYERAPSRYPYIAEWECSCQMISGRSIAVGSPPVRSVLRGWLARLGLPEREPDAIDEATATSVLRRGVDQRWSPSDWVKWAGGWRSDRGGATSAR